MRYATPFVTMEPPAGYRGQRRKRRGKTAEALPGTCRRAVGTAAFARKHPGTLAAAVAASGWLMASPVAATEPEYLATEGPAPESVEQVEAPTQAGFAPEAPVRRGLFGLRRKLEGLPPFWSDSSVEVNLRSYYLERQNQDAPDNLGWAAGGSFEYQSGWWRERLKLGAVAYTSQKLLGPKDKDGTLLLRPGQRSFSVLGQAYLEGRLEDQIRFRLYRQTFNLPYVNAQDNRMVPNTFEAYTVGRKGSGRLDFVVAHLTKMKTRNSNKFVSMSEAAGLQGTDKGLTMAGTYYPLGENAGIGFIDQYAWDFMNTAYAEGYAAWKVTEDAGLRVSLQYTDQRSVGDELGGDFDTDVFGASVDLSYRSAVLSLAFTTTDNGSDIRSPFGGYPGYVSMMVKDFDRAGEKAWLLGLSYDFGKLGLEGLSASVKYGRGDAPDFSPDQEELDITLDYRPGQGRLSGLWLRLRAAWVDQHGAGAQDLKDYRVILNYAVPIP